MNPNKITSAIADKVLEVVDAGLSHGVGEPIPGKMCVEAAVCYAIGQDHGDDPHCVDASVRDFKIVINDQSWSSKKARALGLRRIAIAQLGTAYDPNKKSNFNREVWKRATALNTLAFLVPVLVALRTKEKFAAPVAFPMYQKSDALGKAIANLSAKLTTNENENVMNEVRNAWGAYLDLQSSKAKINAALTAWAQAGLDALIACKSRGSKFLYLANKADRSAKRKARKNRKNLY